MKKQFLVLTAGVAMVLASCKNETPADAGASQAQVDSIVNARVEAIRAELMVQNDSLINALAQWKADSMIAAMKGTKVAVAAKPKPVSKIKVNDAPATEVKAVAQPTQPTGIQGHSDQNAQSGLNKIQSSSDQKKQSGLSKIQSKADKK